MPTLTDHLCVVGVCICSGHPMLQLLDVLIAEQGKGWIHLMCSHIAVQLVPTRCEFWSCVNVYPHIDSFVQLKPIMSCLSLVPFHFVVCTKVQFLDSEVIPRCVCVCVFLKNFVLEQQQINWRASNYIIFGPTM